MAAFWIAFYGLSALVAVYGLGRLALGIRDSVASSRPPRVQPPVLYQEANVRCGSRKWFFGLARCHVTVTPDSLRLDVNRTRTRTTPPFTLVLEAPDVQSLTLAGETVRVEVGRPAEHAFFEMRAANPHALHRALQRFLQP